MMNNLLGSQSSTLNLNIDQKTLQACIKEINNIGNDIYQNICTGQGVTVPWGTQPWINLTIAIIFAVIILALCWSAFRPISHNDY